MDYKLLSASDDAMSSSTVWTRSYKKMEMSISNYVGTPITWNSYMYIHSKTKIPISIELLVNVPVCSY